MANFGLYDLSPLSGDQLEYASSVEVSPYEGQDGSILKSYLIQGHEESSTPHHGQEYGWMDSSMDLLQFLTGEEVAPLEPEVPNKSSIREADSAIAVEILKSVAEDTTKMLDSGNDPGMSPDTKDSIDWFDMLDDEVSRVLTNHVEGVEDAPVLSPVTAEDVESILSSGSASPVQEESITWVSVPDMLSPPYSDTSMDESILDEVSDIPSDLEQLLAQVEKNNVNTVASDHSYDQLVVPSPSKDKRAKPYSRSKAAKTNSSGHEKILDRKERKKQQNKDAALRYRLKKKQEATVITSEVDILEARNNELKDSVDQMTREIQYLKNLLTDVYKAKGLMKS